MEVSPDGRAFAVHTATSTYAFAVDPNGLLRHLFWGPRLASATALEVPATWDLSTNDPVADITPEEYPAHGGFRYKEQALAVRLADGSRELDLRHTGHTATDDTLEDHLIDDVAGLTVTLTYHVPSDLDVIERWTAITNKSETPIVLTRAMSATFHVPGAGWDLTNVHGYWGSEQQVFTQPVGYAKSVLESRRGISTHHHNPYVMLSRDATETHGEVYIAALAYTGNFAGVTEQSPYGTTAFSIGVNPYDWELTLDPGQTWQTPHAVAARTSEGFDQLSAILHDYGRALMVHPEPRKVLYNSWEATAFDVNEANQMQLADLAAGIGAELFVVDDGWFGQRHSQLDGLGDWYVNSEKFPNGLGPLIDHVRSLGMDFGIWVEPEMVNPPTELFAAHPDWIHHTPNRTSETARDQYVLNFARAEVRAHILAQLDALLTNNEIAFVKWDANRPLSQVGVDAAAAYHHMAGVFDVLTHLRARHPQVLFEACASGGGRIDFGALSVFDDFWTSDNTDAVDRIAIQRGYSLVYPAKAMRAWVTDVPNFLTGRSAPLPFRFHVAMMGSLGIGSDLGRCSPEELTEYTRHIADYKRMRRIVQEGRCHRLLGGMPATQHSEFTAVQYQLDAESVVFVLRPLGGVDRHPAHVRLRGLDPQCYYTYKVAGVRHTESGAFLMHTGITCRFYGDYASEVITVTEVTQSRPG